MEWVSSMLGGVLGGGSSLQSSGEISREHLMAFFEKGKLLFDSKDFRMHLRQGYERGENCELLVNAEQMKIFESLGVNGEYGISYLARIQSLFANDAEVLRVFWEFVSLEEKTLDEAELDEHEFRQKYSKLDEMKLQMAKKEQELNDIPPQERNAMMALMLKQMVEASMQGPDGRCCEHEGHCEHSKAGSSQHPGVVHEGGPMANLNHASDLMSEEEKLRFFESIAAQSK